MDSISNKLNSALLSNKPNVAAIVPLAGYLSFFSQGRNAPVLRLEALFLDAAGQKYPFSYSAQKNMVPSFSSGLLIDYRRPHKTDLVLEDEDGNTLLDTQKKDLLGVVCFQIQTSLECPNRIITCLAMVEPGQDGIWLVSPNEILAHLGVAFIRQIEATIPPEEQALSPTLFPSASTVIEEDYYDEQDF